MRPDCWLPDLLRFMLGTGVRIAEGMALRWFRVDLDEGVAVIGDNLARETGQGLVLHSPKTEAGFRVLPLPDFVVMMLRMRYPVEGFGLAPVFPNALGEWRAPENTGRSIRKFRNAAGYPWSTSHVCRHTAATIADEQGLSAREISGYVGHAWPSFTQDRCMDRRSSATARLSASNLVRKSTRSSAVSAGHLAAALDVGNLAHRVALDRVHPDRVPHHPGQHCPVCTNGVRLEPPSSEVR
jgi:hypothetical protein